MDANNNWKDYTSSWYTGSGANISGVYLLNIIGLSIWGEHGCTLTRGTQTWDVSFKLYW
jgi:hypothetical protein